MGDMTDTVHWLPARELAHRLRERGYGIRPAS